ncbi:uncharacterized protein KQ657_002000 [Scheffersomyces spartinae]|uniref:Uncharacterized protein n=1 Tax=Scheffersomyces spartinae TaxID=45513 RepID=A0A9P8AGZ4_9ASCO|nr:uncharacterized protein KQ657_002000 [Scheffersomyces spartinae]KAG7192281.1 hypothetical protein KQ657_002000 [Scheffersomyces spartinae]
MDAATDAFATKKGYLRNKILAGEQDIDMLTETVQRPVQKYPPQQPQVYQQQQYLQYQEYPPQPQQQQYTSHFDDANHLMSLGGSSYNLRASLMSLQSTASRKKLFHKFRGGSGGGVEDFDDDAGAELPESDVSFEYLKHTRDHGPYGGILSRRQLESAPIIPTLDSLDSKPSNNMEYRRQMNVQRKLALATGVRANSLQSGPPGTMPDYRTMSLNSAPAPPTGYGPRAMSLNGPNGFMTRQSMMQQQQQQQQSFQPQQQFQQQLPGNPRAMSMRGGYGSYNNNNTMGPGMPMQGPNSRTMSLNSNQGPRAMSLQSSRPMPMSNNYPPPRMYNGPQPGAQPFVPNNSQNGPRAMSLSLQLQSARFNGSQRLPSMPGRAPYGPNNGPFQQQQQQNQQFATTYSSQKPSEESLMNVVEEEDEHQVQQENNLSTDSFNPSVVSEDGKHNFSSRLNSASPSKPVTSLDPGKAKSMENSDDDDFVYKFDEEPPSISRKSTLKKTNSMKLRKLSLFQKEVDTPLAKETSGNPPPTSPTFNVNRKSTSSTIANSPSKRVSVLTDNESSKDVLEQKFNVLGATATMNSTASSNNVYYTASSFLLPVRGQNLARLSMEETIEEEDIKTPQLSQYSERLDTPKLSQKADDTMTLHDDLEDEIDRVTLEDHSTTQTHTSTNNNTFKSSSEEEDLNEEVPSSMDYAKTRSPTILKLVVTSSSTGNTPELNGTSDLSRFASNDSTRSDRRQPSFKSIVGNTVFSNFRSPSMSTDSPTFDGGVSKHSQSSVNKEDTGASSNELAIGERVNETPKKKFAAVEPTPTPGRALPSPNIENLTSTITMSQIDDEILYSPTRRPVMRPRTSVRSEYSDSDEDMNSRIFSPSSGTHKSSPVKSKYSTDDDDDDDEEEEEEGTATDENGLSSIIATSGTSTATTTTNTVHPQYTNVDSGGEAGAGAALNPKVRRKPPPTNSPTRVHATRPLSDLVDGNPAVPLETESMANSRRELSILSLQSEDGSSSNKKRDSQGFAGKSKNFLKRWSKASRRLSEDFSGTKKAGPEERIVNNRQSMPLIRNSIHSLSTTASSGGGGGGPQAIRNNINTNVPQPIRFTKEELGIMNANNELLNDLQLVTTELASSIRREISLEKELKNLQLGESTPIVTNSNGGQSFPNKEDYTSCIKTISDLQEKLNKERRLRFISEDHALLWENGQQPSALKLGYEKAEIYQQLLSKNDLVNQLQDKVNELESKNKNNPDLLTKYNELLFENTQLKVEMKQQESNLIQTKQELYEALNNKENYNHTKNLRLINSFTTGGDVDEVAEKIQEYKDEVSILKKQREELREAIGKLSHANNFELKVANDKVKVLEEKVDRLKDINLRLTQRMDSRNSIEDNSNNNYSTKGGKLQGFSIVNPTTNLMTIRDQPN